MELVTKVYYDAFRSAAAHIEPRVAVFTREELAREAGRVAVTCGVLCLQSELEEDRRLGGETKQEIVMGIFRDVSKLSNIDI